MDDKKRIMNDSVTKETARLDIKLNTETHSANKPSARIDINNNAKKK